MTGDVDMTASLGPLLSLPNPILTASGCAAAGRELHQFFDVADLGAVVTKTIQRQPRSGRPAPRMAETPSGMLNSIGLQGPGIEAFLRDDLPWLAEHGARAMVSIAGGTTDDFVVLAQRLAGNPAVAAIEVNISCPNVEKRGEVFACDTSASSRVVSAVRRATDPSVPIFAKLTPDVTDIAAIARGLCRFRRRRCQPDQHLARNGDRHRHPLARPGGSHRGVVGSGHPSGRRAVRLAGPPGPARSADHRYGGDPDGSGRPAVRAGRSLGVSVGTAIFGDPSAPVRIMAELETALSERGFGSLRDAVGFAQLTPDERGRRRRQSAPVPA